MMVIADSAGSVMRCHYVSDLHLERQEVDIRLPHGDVLIIAGDLCTAVDLSPRVSTAYTLAKRDRVFKFVDMALSRFRHVLLIPGNHEHYDGIFQTTSGQLRRQLSGITILDGESVDICGVRFFGATLWSDFDRRNLDTMNRVAKRVGDFYFIKFQRDDGTVTRFKPADALTAHDQAIATLKRAMSHGRPTIVISHHAPSPGGLNNAASGNGLDGAYASDLSEVIDTLPSVRCWIHGHTHVARTYRIGATLVRSNAFGFARHGRAAPDFKVDAHFDVN